MTPMRDDDDERRVGDRVEIFFDSVSTNTSRIFFRRDVDLLADLIARRPLWSSGPERVVVGIS
jgi:hypothetical protein